VQQALSMNLKNISKIAVRKPDAHNNVLSQAAIKANSEIRQAKLMATGTDAAVSQSVKTGSEFA
jgi:hypothetical protein